MLRICNYILGLVCNNIQGCHYEAIKSPCNETIVDNVTESRCTWQLKCDEELETFVRNCGDFFVYYLQPLTNDGIYCTDEIKTNTDGRYCNILIINCVLIMQRWK